MDVLFIFNDAPYGSERTYNGLRLAMTLQRSQAEIGVRIFLLGDAVACAVAGQTTPQGYYNLERMLRAVIAKGGQVKACGTCAGARGISAHGVLEGIEIGTMDQLTQWVVESDNVLTF